MHEFQTQGRNRTAQSKSRQLGDANGSKLATIVVHVAKSSPVLSIKEKELNTVVIKELDSLEDDE